MKTKHLIIEHSKGVDFLELGNIVFCQADDNWTTITHRSQKTSNVCQTLKSIETRIDNNRFFRVHRSFLVNMDCIETIYGSYEILELKGGYRIPVSRRRRSALKAAITIAVNRG